MANQNLNPFVLPGFGQGGEMAQNPIMASMEMMRQAWQGLAGTPGFGTSALSAPMSLEDLDRRIADLRAVENWLRMNLSMLSSTIQGLEVQRATISTLKSFMNTGANAGTSPDGRSPLEVVLGIQHPATGESESATASSTRSRPKDDKSEQAQGGDKSAPHPEDAYNAQAVAAAAQGWWDMVQKQFDTLAAATASTLQGVEAARAAAESNETQAAAPDKPARRPAKKTVRQADSAPTATRTAKKTAARKGSASRKS